MAPSIDHLSECLANRYKAYTSYADSHTCLAVVCYVIKFCSNNLSDIIRRLDELAEVALDLDALGEKDDEISDLITNSFVPHVKEFFKVPKVDQLLDEIPRKENDILAGFLHFLLQMLNSVADMSEDNKQRYAILQRELTFLLTFLGDLPFQRTDLEEVKNLLTEFESVANEAGSLIYSSVLSNPSMETSSFEAQKHALLEKVELLNAMMKEHCSKVQELPEFETLIRTTDAADSLFIVDSLLADLEDVINDRFNLPVDHIKDQVKIIHRDLTSSRALIKDIKLPHDAYMDEVKASLVKIRDVAYEAEYLINLQLGGNVPLWYLSRRLPAVIHKLKVVRIRLQETKKIYDTKSWEFRNTIAEKYHPPGLHRLLELII